MGKQVSTTVVLKLGSKPGLGHGDASREVSAYAGNVCLVTSWYPLNIRESGDYESYDALSENVPKWIRDPLCEVIAVGFSDPRDRRIIDTASANACRAALRLILPNNGYVSGFKTWLIECAAGQPMTVLSILDYLLATNSRPRATTESILSSGNSSWTVGEWGDGHVGLVRRVDATVAAAAAQVISAKTSASHHLAEAWQAAYGLNGSPSSAHSHAIKAVEFAAIPVVSPKDTGATLGKVLGQMRTDGDWIIPFTQEKASGDVARMVVSMLAALWDGQSDRHGGNLQPPPITAEAAQSAVLMATTLVQWFQSGAVRRGTI
jgi:hypothetical protein